MASILFLVLVRRPAAREQAHSHARARAAEPTAPRQGDLSAAIIGVSFGGEAVAMKLGRGGKKSMEGSLARFVICFGMGSTMFASIHLREYPVFFGALAATLVELYEPLGLNDNLTIPVISSVAMQIGFTRIQTCS